MSDSLIDRLHRASFGDPVYVDPLTQQLLREAQEVLEERRDAKVARVRHLVTAFAQAEVQKRDAEPDSAEFQRLSSVQRTAMSLLEGELS